jgi:hypothetical protein
MATILVCDNCGEEIGGALASLNRYDKDGNLVEETDLCRECKRVARKALKGARP